MSKAEAERRIRAAQKQGRIAAVARPSIVVGRYCDGTIGQFTNIYTLVAWWRGPYSCSSRQP